MLVIRFLTRVINGKVVEDKAIYNRQWFLVDDFLLLVIKPPGTWIDDFLQSFEVQLFFSCYQRSFVCPTRSLIRPDRNSKTDGKLF